MYTYVIASVCGVVCSIWFMYCTCVSVNLMCSNYCSTGEVLPPLPVMNAEGAMLPVCKQEHYCRTKRTMGSA